MSERANLYLMIYGNKILFFYPKVVSNIKQRLQKKLQPLSSKKSHIYIRFCYLEVDFSTKKIVFTMVIPAKEQIIIAI